MDCRGYFFCNIIKECFTKSVSIFVEKRISFAWYEKIFIIKNSKLHLCIPLLFVGLSTLRSWAATFPVDRGLLYGVLELLKSKD